MDNVGEITKIELLHGNDTPIIVSPELRVVDGLLSNNEYIIRVTYTYNLNDGLGDRIINKLSPCPSPAYVVPNPNCCYNYNVAGVGYGSNGCGCNNY